MAYKVIDVSQWNGPIDWDTAAKHIDGAIIRCGFGSDFASQDDTYWERNVTECERLGIPYGVYLYSYATTLDMARSEAAHAIRLLAGHYPAWPVYFDTEEAGTEYASWACADTFCEALESAGYRTGLYTFRSWYNTYLRGYDYRTLWIADFGANDGNPGTPPDIGTSYDAWQYTSNGSVPGVNGRVDVNQFYIAPSGGEKVSIADIAATIHANMCGDDRFGYSWDPRWGTEGAGYATWNIHGRDYTVKCGDYDCSSSIITAWSKALEGTAYEGALSGATYTGNMRSVFAGSGLFDVWDTSSTSAVRGDVYLNETYHTAMCQDGGCDGVYGYDCLSEFSSNESGGAYGGATGDQTGREAWVHAYYDYPWDCTLHYNGKADYEREDDDMTPQQMDEFIERVKHAVWEYQWSDGKSKDTILQDLTGVPDSQNVSNRYNVLNGAFKAAYETAEKVAELEDRIDELERILG